MNWDYPNPFTWRVSVESSAIDALGHVNNKEYLEWTMEAAWAHSGKLGLRIDDYTRLGFAFVARRHELNYLAPTFLHDRLIVGTWIVTNDGKFRSRREYQIIRENDGKTVFRGSTDWVCIRLETGKPSVMPAEFIQAYQPTNV